MMNSNANTLSGSTGKMFGQGVVQKREGKFALISFREAGDKKD